MFRKIFFLFLSLCIILTNVSCTQEKKKYSDGGYYLNTMISVTAYGDKSEEAVKAVMAEVERLDLLLSAYNPESEIYLINSNAGTSPVTVSEETAGVISAALEFSEKTDGAFDISVKPLVDLWNVKAENPVIPKQSEIDNALENVGYKNVVVKDCTVSFLNEQTKIDLGGAAKGYCADRSVEILKSFGIKNALLDLGGNIYALGKNPDGNPWRIGLQDPDGARGDHFRVENLSGKTAVTSGSYERYFEIDGKVYHHIIDPKTGMPSDSGLISATVIAGSSFESDMLSTAVFVMGIEKFNEIKNRFDFDRVIVVDKSNAEYVINK